MGRYGVVAASGTAGPPMRSAPVDPDGEDADGRGLAPIGMTWDTMGNYGPSNIPDGFPGVTREFLPLHQGLMVEPSSHPRVAPSFFLVFSVIHCHVILSEFLPLVFVKRAR